MPARAQWSAWDRPTRIEEGWPDLASWWAAPGRPGYVPDTELGAAFPPSLSGVAWAGWMTEDRRRAPEGWPFPGLLMVRLPIAWYDSVSVNLARDGVEPAAPLAMVRGWGRSPGRPVTRSVFGYRMGSFSTEAASLLLQAGDSARWAEVDMTTDVRSVAGPYGPAGRHRWGLQGRWTAGEHVVSGAFAQRGEASRLESFEEQAGRGESGFLTWTTARARRSSEVTLARAWDSRESFGPALVRSVRDAGGVRGAGRLRVGDEHGAMEFHAGFDELDVRRDADPGFDRTGRSIEAGLLYRRGGRGTLTLGVGGSRHVVTDRTAGFDTLDATWDSGRWTVSPEASYRIAWPRAYAAAALFGRQTPVWSDLAPGETPFLQRVSGRSVEGGVVAAGGSHLRARVLNGTAGDRAVLFRLPLEEQWLRLGAVRDPGPRAFTLAMVEAEWRARAFRTGADAFALAREETSIQPAVDPVRGFRGWAEWRFRLFQGDLGVTLRADAAGIGRRESEATVPVEIPGYVTFGASARLELADVLVTIRARNLEDRRRPEPWVDLATGAEARSPGLAIETSLIWTLFN